MRGVYATAGVPPTGGVLPGATVIEASAAIVERSNAAVLVI